ncbi:alpha-L-rhamnosidase C-terminal domain-containing protein [Silvibacterium dinghuense]|nr:alpha-L-rhamnosidase C-terminal domain-containing protein [Silvibacterium dinghuense]GGH09077.1 hypothetical protein GCM10011586_26890 [Silvibacterium dinghuense]
MLYLLTVVASSNARAQRSIDPARRVVLAEPPPNRLREQFVWTANDAAALDPTLQARVRGQNDKVEPHFFRAHFYVEQVPREATLYLAGPRAATVYLNGQVVLQSTDHPTRPKGLTVLHAAVSAALRPGENVIAIEAMRGHSSLHTGADATINQVTYGEVLACKIVPQSTGIDAKPLVISDGSWRSVLASGTGWQEPGFDDTSWPRVQALGVLGMKSDFLQWNADAGLYTWPGYAGISDRLRVFSLQPVTDTKSADGETVDFGREISGRVRITTRSSEPLTVQVSYGESREEAERGKSYLGTRTMLIPPRSISYGPKSGFRYVRVIAPQSLLRRIQIDAQGITYPVRYLGWFESSDPTVNRIWETAAYTARLCMQEGIWDGVKRDRARWMGDLDVTGRTISSVFGEDAAVEETMKDIIGEPPVTRDINTIVGYSALWITGQAELYRHSGDRNYLQAMRVPLMQLVKRMESEVDADGVFRNHEGHKVFVDWSEGFSSDTAESRVATGFELTRAFDEAAFLFEQLGDKEEAAQARTEADQMRAAARVHELTGETFGQRWQTNAMAVLSGSTDAGERDAIWGQILSHIGEGDAVITPYYGYYVLSAMAELGHGREALDWMRRYWGGMLEEGATSFWEAYDPHWPKQDFHAYLQADGKQGYYVSLAHGWSSGPAPWLMERVLGIRPTDAGFREVTIAPELDGLKWARGAEPTPRGAIRVEVSANVVMVTLPPETRATVRLPFSADAVVKQNGRLLPTWDEAGNQKKIVLDHAGTYRFDVTSPLVTEEKHHAP